MSVPVIYQRITFPLSSSNGLHRTPCKRSRISARPATTKYSSNSFVFKTKIEKEGLPRDDTPDLGAGGLRFKSGRPDQSFQHVSGLAIHCTRSTVVTFVVTP